LSLLVGVVSAIVFMMTMVVFAPDGAEDAPIVKLVFGQAGDGSELFLAFIIFIAAAITFPVFEELYYRGFLYGVLEGLIGRIAAAIIVAVWFGLVHAPQVGFGLVAMIVIMMVSTLLTWLRYKYDSLIPALSAHVAYNGTLSLAAMIGFVLS
jgi:membrane protease YdiL (CAAX protease family)